MKQYFLFAALFFSGTTQIFSASSENIVFPPEVGIVNVVEVYGAKGDGKTDNTAALQKAILEVKGGNRMLYFPDGTYLVNDMLNVGNKAHSADRFLTFQGQSETKTIIRLMDNAKKFQDQKNPLPVLSLYNEGSTGDAMHNYVRNLTVDVGTGNPGATGIRFMTNNTGAMYDVSIHSSDPTGLGAIGLDLSQHQYGPGLISRVTVTGFNVGVQTGSSFNQLIEHITLANQREVGVLNNGGNLTIRDLVSTNSVPAVIVNKSSLTLIEAKLLGGSKENTAIINNYRDGFFRDIHQEGYGHLLQKNDKSLVDGADLAEYFEGKGQSPFGNTLTSLRLPIEDTPHIPWESDLSKWELITWSEADDDSDTIQRAFDNAAAKGKTTVCFIKPRGKIIRSKEKPDGYEWGQDEELYYWGWYKISKSIRVHGSVNRILGMENEIVIIDPLKSSKDDSLFILEDLTSPAITIERFFTLAKDNGSRTWFHVDNRSKADVVYRNLTSNAGRPRKPNCNGTKFFLEDVAGRLTLDVGKGESVWCRQYNPEMPEVEMAVVDGGNLWILGLKTEGRATHVIARNGANVEVLGGISYQSWKGQKFDPPMFVVEDSNVSVVLPIHGREQPFSTIVRETYQGETKTVDRKDATNHLPLYRSGSK